MLPSRPATEDPDHTQPGCREVACGRGVMVAAVAPLPFSGGTLPRATSSRKTAGTHRPDRQHRPPATQGRSIAAPLRAVRTVSVTDGSSAPDPCKPGWSDGADDRFRPLTPALTGCDLPPARAAVWRHPTRALDMVFVQEGDGLGFALRRREDDPDLLIRTAGEMRVSNYLLWQITYAEL